MAKTVVQLSDTFATWVSKTNTIVNTVGDLASLATTQDSDIIGAINEVNTTASNADSNIGTLSSLDTLEKSSLVAAINELQAEIGVIDSDLAFTSPIGNVNNLTTTNKTNIVSAINEINAEVRANLNDSAEIKGLFASSTDIQFDSSTGQFNLGGAGGGVRAFFQSSGTITFDSSSGQFNLVDVITSKLADSAVTTAKIDRHAVGTLQIADNAITTAKYADSSIGFAQLQAGSIKSANFNGMQTLNIINSGGTTVKTMYSPGS